MRIVKFLGSAVFIILLAYGLASWRYENGAQTPAIAAVNVVPDADAVTGHVLPFKIIAAIRNLGFRDGMIDAQISVSVESGNAADWMATAIYIAEHSIINGATFSQVEVYVPNPSGDMPPQHSKKLAQVYYSPDPPRSPWPNDNPWLIMSAVKAGSLADIQYDELDNDLLADARFAKIEDLDKRQATVDAEARKLVIQKYRLLANWEPADDLGLTGLTYRRGHVVVIVGQDMMPSLQALHNCLQSNSGTPIFRGCYPMELRSR